MANVDKPDRQGGTGGMREGVPEKVIFEPDMTDVKKQVMGRNKGKLLIKKEMERSSNRTRTFTGEVVSSEEFKFQVEQGYSISGLFTFRAH